MNAKQKAAHGRKILAYQKDKKGPDAALARLVGQHMIDSAAGKAPRREKPSAAPWYPVYDDGLGGTVGPHWWIMRSPGGDGMPIAQVRKGWGPAKANAERICRSVNSHDSLVDALRDLIALETGDHESCSWCDADDVRRHASDCPFYAAYATFRAAGGSF